MPDVITPVIVNPIAPIDTMNKTELYRHLTRYHSTTYSGLTSKSSREGMEKVHTAQHAECNFAVSQVVLTADGKQVENPDLSTFEERQAATYYPSSVHEHIVASAEPTPNERELLEQITSADGARRVLSPTERKALERLIDNDFATLRTEMKEYGASILEERSAAARSEFGDKRMDAASIEADIKGYLAGVAIEVQKRLDGATKKGIKVTLPSYLMGNLRESEGAYKATVEGLEEKLRAIRAEVQRDIGTALSTLERQRLAAQRLVLLAGVSDEGRKLLATVPSARELMLDAAQQSALTAGG